MVSEEEFTHALIAAVERLPVLYNVHLQDYKNKNKKGEAFKNVQRAVRLAGCSEAQVLSTYKKWISLKRKFRVEYFRLKSEDPATAQCNFRYFDALSFLVPYCHLYEQSATNYKKINGKRTRRHSAEFELTFHDDFSEDDGPHADEEEKFTPLTLDQLLMSRAKKLKVERVECENGNVEPIAKTMKSTQSEPPTSSQAVTATRDDSTVNSIIKRLFGSGYSEQAVVVKQQKKQQHLRESEPTSQIVFNQKHKISKTIEEPKSWQSQEQMSDATVTINAQNELFGQLVASELDKLPESFHNVIRSQILLFLAYANSAAANFNGSTSKSSFGDEKIFNYLFG